MEAMKYMSRLGLFIASLFIVAAPAQAQQNVTVSLPDTAGNIGETMMIPLMLEDQLPGSPEARSLQATITYDPAVISFTENIDTTGTLIGDLSMADANVDESGTLIVAAANGAIQQGPGVLIYVEVELLQDGASDLTFDYFAFNDGEEIVSTTVNGAIIVGNRSPDVDAPIDDRTLNYDGSADIDLEGAFSDPDGDELTYEAVSGNSSVVSTSVNGGTLTVSAEDAGSTTVTVTARDADGEEAVDEFSVTVEPPPNQAPVVDDQITNRTLEEGATEQIDLSTVFSDPDGDPLSFSSSSDDTDAVTTSISDGMLTVTAVSEGAAIVNVTASDGEGGEASDDFIATVSQAGSNQAPQVIQAIDDQSFEEDESFEVDLSTVFSDPDGDALSWSASSSNTDAATVEVTGSMLIVEGVDPGNATITVTASDGNGGEVEETFSADITLDTGIKNAGPLPENFTLQGTFPNPFRENTTIRFDLPDAAQVTVTVYDVLGRELMDLSPRSMAGGSNRQIELHASGLSTAGTYLYRIRATSGGEQTWTKTGRFVLIK